ncbi:MAG: bifunctional response regulator/alkaline phosphatase family protein [Candidatus Krumholzibacteria bacterium]|nr:bifunctional response regulator/alkaline phosphatase family protein [Candidatus Krumholzibacteria bacterium]
MGYTVLWIDDNIDDLRSHILFLSQKGYEVQGASNGRDGLALLAERPFDAVLLDEMMPGMGGLDTLEEIRKRHPHVPVIMITKSEAEDLMTKAIGRRIDDYLVKPVSPLQIQAALKKQVEARKITSQQVTRDYLTQFPAVGDRIAAAALPADWESIYGDLVTWSLDLYRYSDRGLLDTQAEQMAAANLALGKYVRDRYRGWVHGAADAPILSPQVYRHFVEPEVQRQQILWIIIDCMRLDQWRLVQPLLEPYFRLEQHLYWSILPTATPFSRNAMFAGLYPLDIARGYPGLWHQGLDDDSSRNASEDKLLAAQLERLRSPAAGRCRYYKISDARETDILRRDFASLGEQRLIAGVYNFLDIMSHGRSQSSILKELAPDEAAFCALMRTWFEHSTLYELLQEAARRGTTTIVTTDHGSLFCRRATKVRGNRDASSNVRYKFGDNLSVDEKRVLLIKDPADYKLPPNSSIETYAITTENYYLVYPTNYHEYERLYRDSFQHGGISLEEMICPLAVLRPR